VVSGIFEKAEFKKAEAPAGLMNGILFKRYDKPFTSAYNVGGIPDSTEILDKLEVPSGKSEQFFGVEFSGWIEVPSNGTYTFYLNCDDGAILYVDSQLVVDNDGAKYGGLKHGKIALSVGKHPFEIRYFQGKYGYYIDLKYQLNDEKILQVEPNQFFTLKK
jgi:hexosaminidase